MVELAWKKFVQHLGVESAKTVTRAGAEFGEILTSAGGITIAEAALGRLVDRATGRQSVKLRTNLGVVSATARVRKVGRVPVIDMRSLRGMKVVRPSPLYSQLQIETKKRQEQLRLEAGARKRQREQMGRLRQMLRRRNVLG